MLQQNSVTRAKPLSTHVAMHKQVENMKLHTYAYRWLTVYRGQPGNDPVS